MQHNLTRNLLKGTNKTYFILVIISITSIALYGKYRCHYINKHNDILEFGLFKNSEKWGIDGWSLTHFFGYMIMGYLFPKTLLLTMIGGALWELFETYVGKYKPKLIMGFGFCENISDKTNKYKVWWYGKWSDLVMNFLGFVIGMKLNKYLI